MRGRAELATVVGFAVLGFGAVTAALALPAVRAVDLALRDVSDAHRPPLGYDVAVNVDRLGSGGWLALLAVLIAIGLARRDRSGWPLLSVAAAFGLTGAALTGLKWAFHRAPPHSPRPGAVDLFSDPAGLSYPSGHAVNTIVWYGVICALLAPWLGRSARLAVRVGPPVLVGAASVYLGFHWLTDVLVGVCLGVALDQVVRRIRPAERRSRAPGRAQYPRPERSRR